MKASKEYPHANSLLRGVSPLRAICEDYAIIIILFGGLAVFLYLFWRNF